MLKMLKALPAYKVLILGCISSCITKEQLSVAWDFIELFKTRYSGWIEPLELLHHYNDLQDAYLAKNSALTIQEVL
jgi:hypothetical protein